MGQWSESSLGIFVSESSNSEEFVDIDGLLDIVNDADRDPEWGQATDRFQEQRQMALERRRRHAEMRGLLEEIWGDCFFVR